MKYVEIIIEAISIVLGRIFSVVSGPSILNSCIPPTLSRGKIVIAITTIPIPPSHCIIALHIKILLGLLSKSEIIVAPVVVIPDILSKKASLKVNSFGDSKKGKLPNIATINQAKVENKKVCCKLSLNSCSKLLRTNNTGKKTVEEIESFLATHGLKLRMDLIGWPPINFDQHIEKYQNQNDPLSNFWELLKHSQSSNLDFSILPPCSRRDYLTSQIHFLMDWVPASPKVVQEL